MEGDRDVPVRIRVTHHHATPQRIVVVFHPDLHPFGWREVKQQLGLVARSSVTCSRPKSMIPWRPLQTHMPLEEVECSSLPKPYSTRRVHRQQAQRVRGAVDMIERDWGLLLRNVSYRYLPRCLCWTTTCDPNRSARLDPHICSAQMHPPRPSESLITRSFHFAVPSLLASFRTHPPPTPS